MSVPPSKLLSGSVKVTSASMICGAALTVFSRKVTGVARPVSVGTEFVASAVPAMLMVTEVSVPSALATEKVSV